MTLPSPALPTAPVRVVAEAGLPTEHGTFRLVAFDGDLDGREHVALVHGELGEGCDVLVRLHSECLTGDTVILYLRQEGRKIGLTNKVRAYARQDGGLDTVDANRALGFADDGRDDASAAGILRALGVRSVRRTTNHPDKIAQLRELGVAVVERVPHQLPSNPHNARYLATKAVRSGHLLRD